MNMTSDDHRAELLDRAYRRGYALRRRRRALASIAGLATIAVIVAGVASVSTRHGDRKVSVVQQSTTTTTPPTCVTGADPVPAAEVPTDVAAWAGGAPVIGEGALWTVLSATHVRATPYNGGYNLKFPWLTRPDGPPVIDARRIDGPGTFHADANRSFDARGVFEMSGLEFSTAGCWEVTAHYLSSTLQFRVLVSPTPTDAVFVDQNNGFGLDSTCNVPPAADPVCDFDIFSSSDAGRSWTRVGGERAVAYPGWRGYPDIELAASGSNVWVYGTKSFESHDGGRTVRDAGFGGIASALVPEGNDVWVLSRTCALCTSETLLSAPVNGGQWTTIPGFPDLRDPYVALVRPSATVAYVVGTDTHPDLYRSDDAGRSWQSHPLPPAPPASPRTYTVSLAASGADQVWMLNGGDASGRSQQKALYRSDDGGAHWILVADTGDQREGVGRLPSPGLTQSLTVATPQDIWVAFSRGPFTGSVDGGLHWLDTGIDYHIAGIDFVDPLHGWAWNGDPSYRTTDGRTWEQIKP
jgi:hypothetical protein